MESMPGSESRGHDFTKKNKVSVWVSQHPYTDIPDSYFEERFSKKKSRANNVWSDNYNLAYFLVDNMETNGAQTGTIKVKEAAGHCSFSTSYISTLMSKAKKKNIDEITWIILLFDFEYSPKISGVEKDQYTTFLGAFNYDDESDNLYELI
ncbi:immunity 22 family protein [Alkalimarinus sediminis]|uniref:Immunity 22 family protein n=1 Tax=Alkalimarinus sediminis TaxID=1632866 RepID=A0A9E8HVA4_9ALTE|nr:immunity 22 family protein [Alkalimarinus sediminis]UZW76409.1 immunity 22 family protein [Alkalimarinus sediminis]